MPVRLRRARYVGGQWHDLLLFSITTPALMPTVRKWGTHIGLPEL
jgi:hypothetical protein